MIVATTNDLAGHKSRPPYRRRARHHRALAQRRRQHRRVDPVAVRRQHHALYVAVRAGAGGGLRAHGRARPGDGRQRHHRRCATTPTRSPPASPRSWPTEPPSWSSRPDGSYRRTCIAAPVHAPLARAARRSVAQLARAPVSKTGGWGFESLHSCQPRSCQSQANPLKLLRCDRSQDFGATVSEPPHSRQQRHRLRAAAKASEGYLVNFGRALLRSLDTLTMSLLVKCRYAPAGPR